MFLQHKKTLITSFTLLFSVMLFAQNVLTPNEAMRILMEQNFDIRVAQNDRQIAVNNTSKELNGYLPTLDASAGSSGTLGSSTQQLFNGQENKVNNAFSWGANASVNANYVVYNQSRELTVDQLKEVLNLTDLQLRQTMELNLLQTMSAYYDLAQLREQLDLQKQAIELSRRRKQRAEYRYEYGQGSRLDVLNAQVDIQRDTVTLLNLEQQISNAKRNLTFLMGLPMDVDFRVDTSVQYLDEPKYQSLLRETMQENIQLLLLQQNLVVQEYDLKLNEATRRPIVSTQANYNFNFQDNAAGSFVLNSSSRGLNFGVNVAWNLWDGGVRKMRAENIRVGIQSQLIQREQIEQQLETDLANAWQTYQNALFILEVEKENRATAQLNFERTEEQFNAGQISSVEFRQAQLNLLNAGISQSAAKYNAKVVELQLLQLSGQLLEEI
ncbi:MAG: TolC family protein [Bacteroidota bacterium]